MPNPGEFNDGYKLSFGAGVVDENTQRVTLASDSPGVSAGVSAGAPNFAVTQTALSTTAGLVLAARATRRRATIRNLDAAINVYLGGAAVTSANGMLLKPGEAYIKRSTAAIYAVAASGTPSVAADEEYD
jgi:hypothetical protein